MGESALANSLLCSRYDSTQNFLAYVVIRGIYSQTIWPVHVSFQALPSIRWVSLHDVPVIPISSIGHRLLRVIPYSASVNPITGLVSLAWIAPCWSEFPRWPIRTSLLYPRDFDRSPMSLDTIVRNCRLCTCHTNLQTILKSFFQLAAHHAIFRLFALIFTSWWFRSEYWFKSQGKHLSFYGTRNFLS